MLQSQISNDLLVIMGVSGSGKTTVARAISWQTGWLMIEGDDLHPQANIDKMTAGKALNNDDRVPWIDAIAQLVNQTIDGPILLACSALNDMVRNGLIEGVERNCRWIYLDVPKTLLRERLSQREDHFMPESLLESQLNALDPPIDAITIDASLSLQNISNAILTALNERIEQ